MKKLILIIIFLFLASQTVFSQGVFNSAQSGNWNSASTWTLVSGSDSDGIPDSDDDATILNGHTVSIVASQSIKNLTINNGGVLQGPNTGTTIYYLRIYGTSLLNDGTLGGSPDGTRLGLEPANSNGTVTISGTGVCELSQIRPYSGSLNVNIVIDQNMYINRSWSRGLGLTAYRDNHASHTLTINSGRTVTLDSTADFHLGSTSSAVKGANITYNINGTLKTNAGQRFILIPFDSTGYALTINVNGTLDLGGKVFGYRVTQSQVGPINVNVNSGGVVKVSGTPATAELDLRDVTVTLNGTGYMDVANWTLLFSSTNYFRTLGTGGLKRTVGATDVVFPVGTSTSYNPVTLSNTGTVDKFLVSVKSSFDNPPVDPNKVVNRQWSITEDTPGGSSGDISLQWNSVEEAAGFTRNVDLVISRYTGTNWESKGASLSGSDPYVAKAMDFTTFSNFIVESRPTSSFHLSANSIDFGNVEIGTSKKDSVYVKNVGTSSFNISSVTSDNPSFTVEPSSATVPVGDSVKFRVTFSPTALGEQNGTITFVHNGGDSPHLLAVSGTGTVAAPLFSVSPNNLNFGTIAVGRSRTDSVKVKNLGGSNLIIDSVKSFSNDFSVLPSTPVSIPPADSMMFYVKFSPTTEGTQSGNLSFYNNSPTSPNNITVTGSALTMYTRLSNGTGGGDWASTSTWQGGVLPSIVDSVVILSSDSVFLSSDVTIGGLQVNGILQLLDTLRTIYGTVYGKVRTAGATNASAIIPSGSLRFMNGSIYIHGINGGTIPVSIWEDGSTCEVTGFVSSSKPGNLNQNFYNFNWKCAGQTATVDLGWYNNTIRGNITFANPSGIRTQMTSPGAGSPNTITILGNIYVLSGHFTSNGSSSSADITVNTYGNIIVTGNNPDTISYTNFSVSRGSGPSVAWNLYGDLIMSNATTQNSAPDKAKFVFVKNGSQQFSMTNSAFASTVPFEISSVSTVNLNMSSITYSSGGPKIDVYGTLNAGNSVIGGSAPFTLNDGATFITAHSGGINGNVATTGTKSFSTTANYVFNGTSAQVTGSFLPSPVNNLTINNSANVTLSSSVTVSGLLSILSGDLITSDKVITLSSGGVLSETAGNTVIGTVVTTRDVLQGVNNSFGGIGIEINALGASPGSTYVERVTGVSQTGNGKYSILRYFNINPTVNIGLNATFVFKYDNSELNGQDANTLQLFKSTDDGLSWMNMNGTTNPAENKITLTGVGSFSRWTAADANNIIGEIPFTFNVSSGWNMVSVPLSVDDYRKIVLFPGATSNAFTFDNGYVQKDTLENGKGYWLKFPNAGDAAIFGRMIFSDSVDVKTGWNMIGSISVTINKNNVVPSSGVNVLSQFYGYQAGYTPVDSLKPGKAYWVKVSAAGKLYFTTSGFSKSFGTLKDFEELNSITITDADGNSQTLYFGNNAWNKLPVEYLELPPSAPAGTFDVRFSSQRIAELHPENIQNNCSYPITISSAVYPITVSWDIKKIGNYTYVIFDGTRDVTLKNSGSIKITNNENGILKLKVNSTEIIPKEYSLGKNYPNPFNPTTSFNVEIPVESKLSLKVFNLLGQEVAELASGVFEPGSYTFTWNGLSNSKEQQSSGIYFYKMEAKSLIDNKSFTSIQKMILMK
ncbi:MAG: Cell surface protein [Ignavibacteriae bacterium]|nr:MAG: Cell surface protein [Ignavibacteriota bacterium]